MNENGQEKDNQELQPNGNQKKALLTRRWLTIAGGILAILLLLITLIINSAAINRWLASVLRLFRPILIGLAIAYLLNPVFRFFERRAFCNVHPLRLRRILSIICSYLFLVLILALLVVLIVPQLVASISSFIENYPTYMQSAVGRYNGLVNWVDTTLARFGASQTFLQQTSPDEINDYLGGLLRDTSRLFNLVRKMVSVDTASNVIDAIGGVIAVIADIIFSFFISLYLLSTKEQRYAQTMKLRRAIFSDRTNAYITRVCTVADRSFGSFLEGKFFDSLIIGILTYIVLIIFRIPYPLLNAAIIGITNIVPIIGPIFGAVPTAVIVLLTEPAKVIPFLLIVLAIQQIDGNIIGPKILGSSNGVSSLCVLIAITTMGNIWGLFGMLISVPLFATVLDLLDTFVEDRLRARGLPSATENYYPPDSPLDPATDMQSGSEKSLRRFESKVLRLRILVARGEKVSVWDRFVMWLYEKARKFSIIPEISAETLTQFAVDEVIRNEELSIKQQIIEQTTDQSNDL